MDDQFLSQIEDAALNAWPVPREMLLDGWLLRFAKGYTKRANSVNVRYESRRPLAEKIGLCEDIYDREGLLAIFRLPDPFTSKPLLDALDQAGYQLFDPTFVLGREIAHFDSLPEAVTFAEMDQDAWIHLRAGLTHTSLADWAVHQEILSVIVPQKGLMGVYVGEDPIACGMAVLEGALLGYFSIYVDEKFRKKGFGQATMNGLTNWGVARGAEFGYLQVEGDNQPALALYKKMGFGKYYRYIYSKKK